MLDNFSRTVQPVQLFFKNKSKSRTAEKYCLYVWNHKKIKVVVYLVLFYARIY